MWTVDKNKLRKSESIIKIQDDGTGIKNNEQTNKVGNIKVKNYFH